MLSSDGLLDASGDKNKGHEDSRAHIGNSAFRTALTSIAGGDRVDDSGRNMLRQKRLPKRSVRLPGARIWNEKWWKYGINFGGASRHERQDRDPVGSKIRTG